MLNRTFYTGLLSTFIALVIGITSCATKNHFHPKTDAELARVSVEITNYERTSGGSGVILHSDNSGSVIETNRHVCQLVIHGGLVIDTTGLGHRVMAYKESERDDLCLIQIGANLKIGVDLADHTPEVGDAIAIVGHPLLQPTVTTRGQFSYHTVIQINEGIRPCSEAEKADPLTGMFCAIYGGIPNIIDREAQFTSALIQPGSSGSPCFDENGYLSGFAFAGSGNIGFGYIVPLEAVYQFQKDAKHMGWTLAQ